MSGSYLLDNINAEVRAAIKKTKIIKLRFDFNFFILASLNRRIPHFFQLNLELSSYCALF